MQNNQITDLIIGSRIFLLCGLRRQGARSPRPPRTWRAGSAAATAARQWRRSAKVSGEAKTDFTRRSRPTRRPRRPGSTSGNCGRPRRRPSRIVYEDHPKLLEAKFNEGVVWEECGTWPRPSRSTRRCCASTPSSDRRSTTWARSTSPRGSVSQAVNYFTARRRPEELGGLRQPGDDPAQPRPAGRRQLVKEAMTTCTAPWPWTRSTSRPTAPWPWCSMITPRPSPSSRWPA